MNQLTKHNDGLRVPGAGRRRAFTILEIVVSIFLLFSCFTVFAQLRSALISQQQRFDSADIARHQLQNVWEILANESDEAILSGSFKKERVESLVTATLPQGKIEFKVVPLVFHTKGQTDLAPAPDKEKSPKGQPADGKVTVHLVQAIISWEGGANQPRRSKILSRIMP